MQSFRYGAVAAGRKQAPAIRASNGASQHRLFVIISSLVSNIIRGTINESNHVIWSMVASKRHAWQDHSRLYLQQAGANLRVDVAEGALDEQRNSHRRTRLFTGREVHYTFITHLHRSLNLLKMRYFKFLEIFAFLPFST